MAYPKIPIEERFWKKVEKQTTVTSGHVSTPCWLWTGGKDKQGYGRVWLNGKLVTAHHVSLNLACIGIPEGLLACHHCDNPSCVNPEHIFFGDHSDNGKDAQRKGRIRGHKWTPETAKQARANRV